MELRVSVRISISELEGLIEIFSFFDKLDLEKIAFGFNFHRLDFKFGFKGRGRLIWSDIDAIFLGLRGVSSSGHEIEFNVTLMEIQFLNMKLRIN